MSWHKSLPPAEASVSCGKGTHTIRWEDGQLTLSDHPDAEAELVLGALGGDKPECLTLLETWNAHTADLAVLAVGPRAASDRTTITWEQLGEAPLPPSRPRPRPRASSFTGGQGYAIPSGKRATAKTVMVGTGAVSPRKFLAAAENADPELARRARKRVELLELMTLGPEFQYRLSGAVAASWAGEDRAGERAERRPELAAALTGRFAPVAAEWAGIDPDAVTVTPHEGPGWGRLEVTGDGRLAGALPVSWLAEVWACGLALADGHLVVSVTGPGHPRARVLALPAPGASAVPLEVDRC
ncbi:MAG: hypothetical protein FWE35_03140 [Streptosporangiales bacterium]|nr:hypothetical protein [Streptosporangiales bacterium]